MSINYEERHKQYAIEQLQKKEKNFDNLPKEEQEKKILSFIEEWFKEYENYTEHHMHGNCWN